jgi:hypothetical protein
MRVGSWTTGGPGVLGEPAPDPTVTARPGHLDELTVASSAFQVAPGLQEYTVWFTRPPTGLRLIRSP